MIFKTPQKMSPLAKLRFTLDHFQQITVILNDNSLTQQFNRFKNFNLKLYSFGVYNNG